MLCSSLTCQLRTCQHPLCLPICPSFLTDMLWLSRGSGNCTMGIMQNPSSPALEQAHINLAAILSPDSVGIPQHASPTPCRSLTASHQRLQAMLLQLRKGLSGRRCVDRKHLEYICGCVMHMVACSELSQWPCQLMLLLYLQALLHPRLACCNSHRHIALHSLSACQTWLLRCKAVLQGSVARQ